MRERGKRRRRRRKTSIVAEVVFDQLSIFRFLFPLTRSRPTHKKCQKGKGE